MARGEGVEVTQHAKGFAPVVKFPTGNTTLLLAGSGRSRKDVKRRMWFFNTKREPVEVLEVLPVSVIARTWPEPCREVLHRGTRFWFVDITQHIPFSSDVWQGTVADAYLLERGLVHTTLEAAQAHADALLSLSK